MLPKNKNPTLRMWENKTSAVKSEGGVGGGGCVGATNLFGSDAGWVFFSPHPKCGVLVFVGHLRPHLLLLLLLCPPLLSDTPVNISHISQVSDKSIVRQVNYQMINLSAKLCIR